MTDTNKTENLKERISSEAQERKESLSKNGKLALAFISILAVMIFLAGINKPHLNPFKTKLDMDGATLFSGAASQIAADSLDAKDSGGFINSSAADAAANQSDASDTDADCGAIVDSQRQRLLITDGSAKLLNAVDMTKSGSPVDIISSILVDGENIYVAGYKTYNKGEYITSESIVRYGKDGKLEETIFTKDIDESEFVTEPTIKQLLIVDEECEALSNLLSDTQSSDASEAGSGAGGDTSGSASDASDDVSLNGKLCALVAEGENAYIYTSENEYSKPVYERNIGEHVQTLRYSKSLEEIVVVARSSRLYELYSGNVLKLGKIGEDGINLLTYGVSGEVSYSVGYIIRNIIHWLSLAWIVVMGAALLIYLLFFRLTGKGKAAIVIVGCIVVASVYYSSGIASSEEKIYENNIITMAKQYSRIASYSFDADIYRITRSEGVTAYCQNPNNKETIESIQQLLKSMVDDSGKENSYSVKSYLIEGDKIYTFVSSGNSGCIGVNIGGTDAGERIKNNLGNNDAIKVKTGVSERIESIQPVYDGDGNAIAAIVVGFAESNLKQVQSNNCIDMLVNLLAIFIALFVGYTCFRDVLGDFKLYRQDKANGVQGAESQLSSAFNILYKFCCAMDTAIVVYVAQSLCADMPLARQAIVVALPSAAYSLGTMIGKFIGPFMIRKGGYRGAAVISCILTAASSLVMMFSVGITSIIIFIAAKFVSGIFSAGVLFMAGESLPYVTDDKEKRDNILASSSNTTTAAIILTAIVYGYISQYLSYGVIYLFAAILAVVMLLLCLVAFKSDKTEEDDDEEMQEAKKASSKAAWAVVIKPAMIMYFVGYMIPTMLFTGYSGYLFPLYSAGAGLTALLLSNLSAFAKTVSYITFDSINNFARQFSQSSVMVATLLIDAACLLCFILSPNIYWAIAVLFIFSCTSGVGTYGSKLYVNDVAEEYEVDVNDLRNNSNEVTSVIYIFESPSLSAFVGLGINAACAAVGAVGGALAAIFGIYNKKRRKS